MHQFCGEVDASQVALSMPAHVASHTGDDQRIAELEEQVSVLREELDELKALVQSLL